MREIQAQQITDVVEKLCIEANQYLPGDVQGAIRQCRACEDWEIAQGVLDKIITNFEIAENESVPICQDTGMACVFLEIGQDVHIVGGDLSEEICSKRPGAPWKYRRQYPGDALYRNRSGRADKSDRRTERLRKRKYEHDPHV